MGLTSQVFQFGDFTLSKTVSQSGLGRLGVLTLAVTKKWKLNSQEIYPGNIQVTSIMVARRLEVKYLDIRQVGTYPMFFY